MFRFWRNFPFMVAAGLVVGLATGGIPATITTPAEDALLILAMAFSLTEISFGSLSLRAEARGIGLALLMTYGILGGVVLALALLTQEGSLRDGWVLVAAVPPAVLIVPVTSFLRGDVRSALIADAVLYLLGLATVPALTLALLGQSVPIGTILVQTLLLIGLPILLSRPLARWSRIQEARPTAVSVAFFFLVLTISGAARGVLLQRPDLLAGLFAIALLRTFGLGLLILAATDALRSSRRTRIASTTFGGFKNLGLAVVLASSVFGPTATLPAIACLIFETAWMTVLPLLFRTSARGVTEISE